jgi:hypothetical protein
MTHLDELLLDRRSYSKRHAGCRSMFHRKLFTISCDVIAIAEDAESEHLMARDCGRFVFGGLPDRIIVLIYCAGRADEYG